ncbi:hypothetical protein BKI52_07590 [marine bacterium AO1-C]|nr:hypothetical protein BKI52_07590 [marine bacterium AO1-C]
MLIFLMFAAFTPSGNPKFKEIDVERINIVEKDGTMKLVLTNKERSPGAIVDGKYLYEGGGRTGMLFYNDEGDECGGLVYGNHKGSKSASSGLMFDQYKQDQVIAIQYGESTRRGKKSRMAGIQINERPDTHIADLAALVNKMNKAKDPKKKALIQKELQKAQKEGKFGAPRLYLGNVNKTAILQLKDHAGRTRFRVKVDSAGTAKLQFLDELGKVMYQLPSNK